MQNTPTRMNVRIRGGDMSEWQTGSEATFILDEENEAFKETLEVPIGVINRLSVNVAVSGWVSV